MDFVLAAALAKAAYFPKPPSANVAGYPLPTGWKLLAKITGLEIQSDIKPVADTIDYGFVATNGVETAVSIPGTQNLWQWALDAEFLHKPFDAGTVEDGFLFAYESLTIDGVTAGEYIGKLLSERPKVTLIGHSLGAAIATLFAFDIASVTKLLSGLITFASPMVGDQDFAEAFGELGIKAARIFNDPDLVPRLPRGDFVHVGTPFKISSWPADKDLTPSHTHAIETYLELLERGT